ncbi:MAG: hypothetical protein QNL04_09060 [SAR324 cluster bacterium]|nr:hypothetical protein [SAR324 cluster bacterium]
MSKLKQTKKAKTFILPFGLLILLSSCSTSYNFESYQNHDETNICKVSIPSFRKNNLGKNIVSKLAVSGKQNLGYFLSVNNQKIEYSYQFKNGAQETKGGRIMVHNLKLTPGIYSLEVKDYSSQLLGNVKFNGFKCNAGQILYVFSDVIAVKKDTSKGSSKPNKRGQIIDAKSGSIVWEGFFKNEGNIYSVDLEGL